MARTHIADEAVRNSDLPMGMVIQVNSTNGTTMQMGIARVCKFLLEYKTLQEGEVIQDEFYRVEILKANWRLTDG